VLCAANDRAGAGLHPGSVLEGCGHGLARITARFGFDRDVGLGLARRRRGLLMRRRLFRFAGSRGVRSHARHPDGRVPGDRQPVPTRPPASSQGSLASNQPTPRPNHPAMVPYGWLGGGVARIDVSRQCGADGREQRQAGRQALGARRAPPVHALLFVVAEMVRRHDPHFADFHRRLTDAGKPKKAVRMASPASSCLNAKARDVRHQHALAT
jgi:hypothetical protein